MRAKRQLVTVQLTPADYEALRVLAEEEDRSVSAVCRRAIRAELRAKGRTGDP